jgi:hypothetical protein
MWMGADLFIGTKQVEVFADGEPVEGFLARTTTVWSIPRFGIRVRGSAVHLCYVYHAIHRCGGGVSGAFQWHD